MIAIDYGDALSFVSQAVDDRISTTIIYMIDKRMFAYYDR
jgi:hypothetical protein